MVAQGEDSQIATLLMARHQPTMTFPRHAIFKSAPGSYWFAMDLAIPASIYFRLLRPSLRPVPGSDWGPCFLVWPQMPGSDKGRC